MNADPNNSKLASVAYTINFNDEDKTNRNNKINLLIERHLARSSTGSTTSQSKTRHKKNESLSSNFGASDDHECEFSTNRRSTPSSVNLPRKSFDLKHTSTPSTTITKKTKHGSRKLHLDLPPQTMHYDSGSDKDLISFESPECDKFMQTSSSFQTYLDDDKQSTSLIDQSIEADFNALNENVDNQSIKSNETYIIDPSKYTDEEKARISIDDYFKIRNAPITSDEKTRKFLNNFFTSAPNNGKSNLEKKFNEISITNNQTANNHGEKNVNKQLFMEQRHKMMSTRQSAAIDDDDDSMLEVAFSVPLNDMNKKNSKVVVNVSQKNQVKLKPPVSTTTTASLNKSKNCFRAEISLNGNNLSKSGSFTASSAKKKDCNCSNDVTNETQSILKQTQQFISSLQARLMLNDESTDEHDDDRLASSKINKTSRYLKQNNVKISSTSNKSRNNNAPVLRRSIAANIKNQKFNELSRSSSCSSNVIGSSTREPSDKNRLTSRSTRVLNSHLSLQKSASARILLSSATSSSSIDDTSEKKCTTASVQLTNTRYNRAFALRRARLEIEEKTPVSILKRRQQSLPVKRPERPASVTKRFSAPKGAMPSNNFVRGNSGRSSVSSDVRKTQKPVKDKKISNHEREMENWKRRQSYDPLKAASEGRKKELLKKQQNDNPMVRSCLGNVDDANIAGKHKHEINLRKSQSFDERTKVIERKVVAEYVISSDSDDNDSFSGTILLD